MLINVKMRTIVGILTFISMINTTSDRLKARHFFICWYFSFYEQLKFHAQLSWAWKKLYNLRACVTFTKIFISAWLTYILLVSTYFYSFLVVCSGLLCGNNSLQFYMVAVSIVWTRWHEKSGITQAWKVVEYMDLAATKPVFGVWDKVRFKPVSSATETS